jgi:hypothetical protein
MNTGQGRSPFKAILLPQGLGSTFSILKDAIGSMG